MRRKYSEVTRIAGVSNAVLMTPRRPGGVALPKTSAGLGKSRSFPPLASAVLGDRYGIPWDEFRRDYTEIRHRIGRVVPGCAAYAAKVERPGGFVLPHPPRDSRTVGTVSGSAVFSVSPLDMPHIPEGRLVLQTLRSRHAGGVPGGQAHGGDVGPSRASMGSNFP